jgi:hypothetical protein
VLSVSYLAVVRARLLLRVWGSNAPRRKYVSPAGSTRTKRFNLLRVTPAVLLQHAARTRNILLLPAGSSPYT